MKQGKKPTVQQARFIYSKGLNPGNWFVSKDTPTEMILVHRNFDNQIKTISKI